MRAKVTRNVAMCKGCGLKIAQNGVYWEHLGESLYCKGILPIKSTIYPEEIEVDVEEYLNG